MCSCALGPSLEPRLRRYNARGLVVHGLVQRLGDRAWAIVGRPVRRRVDIRLWAVVVTDHRRRVTELAGVRIDNVRDLRLVTHPEHAASDEP